MSRKRKTLAFESETTEPKHKDIDESAEVESDEVIVVHQDSASFAVSRARLKQFPTSYVYLNWSNPGLEHHKNDIHVKERNPTYFPLIEKIYETGAVELGSNINKDDFELEYYFWFPCGDFLSEVLYSNFVQELQWRSKRALWKIAVECIEQQMGDWKKHARLGNFGGTFTFPLTGEFAKLERHTEVFFEAAELYGITGYRRGNDFFLKWSNTQASLYKLAMKYIDAAVDEHIKRLKAVALERATAGFCECSYTPTKDWEMVMDGERYALNTSIFLNTEVQLRFTKKLLQNNNNTKQKFTITYHLHSLSLTWEL